MAFYDPSVVKVHVLLVDSNMNFLVETSRMIEFNSYRVTSVQEASVASSMLSEGNENFDLVMVDVSSSNIEGFKLVHEAVDMGYIVILMSNDADTTLVKCAIEDGAFLFMEKVNAAEELKYIWQHVLREKARKNKENAALSAGDQQPYSTANNQNDQRLSLSGGNRNLDINVDHNIGTSNTMNRFVPAATNNNVINRTRGRMGATFIEPNNNARTCMKPKMCTEWTPELHDKFIDAVRELGEGRCFPRDILELMNVPGLTRLQVASHLQKCRHGWQPPYEREVRCPKIPKSSNNSKRSTTRVKKYGILPRVVVNASQEYNNASENHVVASQEYNNASENHVAEHSMPYNETQNIIRQGTTTLWNIDVSNNNETMMNEMISSEINVNDLMIGDDASFGFAAADDGLVANSFDLNSFDLDSIDCDNINVSIQNNSEAANQGDDFWSSLLVEDFTNDNI